MRPFICISVISACFIFLISCNIQKEKESLLDLKQEIYKTEKNFEAAAEKVGVPEAFASFADDSAVIKRGDGILIKGKEGIRKYYEADGRNKKIVVKWTADFIDVSSDGTLGYSYGHYVWIIRDSLGKIDEYKGIFHTVWKRQSDGTWKYVWD